MVWAAGSVLCGGRHCRVCCCVWLFLLLYVGDVVLTWRAVSLCDGPVLCVLCCSESVKLVGIKVVSVILPRVAVADVPKRNPLRPPCVLLARCLSNRNAVEG